MSCRSAARRIRMRFAYDGRLGGEGGSSSRQGVARSGVALRCGGRDRPPGQRVGPHVHWGRCAGGGMLRAPARRQCAGVAFLGHVQAPRAGASWRQQQQLSWAGTFGGAAS